MRMDFFLFIQTNQFILLISQVNNVYFSWLLFHFLKSVDFTKELGFKCPLGSWLCCVAISCYLIF